MLMLLHRFPEENKCSVWSVSDPDAEALKEVLIATSASFSTFSHNKECLYEM
jgi:hypothetical protein